MTSEAILEVPGVVKHFENYFPVKVTSEGSRRSAVLTERAVRVRCALERAGPPSELSSVTPSPGRPQPAARSPRPGRLSRPRRSAAQSAREDPQRETDTPAPQRHFFKVSEMDVSFQQERSRKH